MRAVVLIIYVDSIAFVSGTAIISNGFGVDSSPDVCSKAVLLCLGCYMTTKVSIFAASDMSVVQCSHSIGGLYNMLQSQAWVLTDFLKLLYYFLVERVVRLFLH